MPVCLCPSCKQMISSSARVCEHCKENLAQMGTGRWRTAFFIVVLVGIPIGLSLYSRGFNPTITRLLNQQQLAKTQHDPAKLKNMHARLKREPASSPEQLFQVFTNRPADMPRANNY